MKNFLRFMKIKSILEHFFCSPFHNNTQVLFALLTISYTFLAIGSGWGYFNAYAAPNFEGAFIFTFLMALVLAIYVCNINCWLHAKYPERLQFISLFTQFFYGVCIPLFVELVAVECFFIQDRQSIFSNTFFDTDFILVVAYVLFLNAFYTYAHYTRQAKFKVLANYKNRIIPAFNDLSRLREVHRLALMREAPLSLQDIKLEELQINDQQIACAYKVDGIITVHCFNGKKQEVKQTVSKLFHNLSPKDYIKINPACFHHRLLIFSYEELGTSRRLFLRLRHPFNHLNHDVQRIVSQGAAAHFKKWI